ncbi:hypothetical protein LCGC14_2017270 [marine sediment metagenome]|uniref:Uncharacterized protein n=1 Tax=marine sediment metagenome TaxID=412755 RepID=A0A0F9HVP2_9ZZZZ
MRPEGWDKQRLLGTIIEKLDDYDRVLVEAGADAILKGLKRMVKEDPSKYGIERRPDLRGWFMPDSVTRKGYLVFIED